jgi:hypothetical protein
MTRPGASRVSLPVCCSAKSPARCVRELALARRLSQDSEVTNRLIRQALYFLGIGPRKHEFDQKLVGGRVFSRHWKIKHGAF